MNNECPICYRWDYINLLSLLKLTRSDFKFKHLSIIKMFKCIKHTLKRTFIIEKINLSSGTFTIFFFAFQKHVIQSLQCSMTRRMIIVIDIRGCCSKRCLLRIYPRYHAYLQQVWFSLDIISLWQVCHVKFVAKLLQS